MSVRLTSDVISVCLASCHVSVCQVSDSLILTALLGMSVSLNEDEMYIIVHIMCSLHNDEVIFK